jgi:hypothetical protein
MKQILTGAISTPVKQPFTKYSLQLLQQAYKEVFNKLVKTNSIGAVEGGTPNDAYIISGLDVYAMIMPSTYQISSGMLFWNGSLYILESGLNVTTTGAEVVCVYIETLYDTHDPVLMSDNSLEYVHQNKRLHLEAGVSGSGGSTNPAYSYLCDFNDLNAERLTYTQAEVDILVGNLSQEIIDMQTTINNSLTDEAWKYPAFNATYWKDAHDVYASYQPSRYKKTHDGYLVMEFHVAGDGSGNMFSTALAAAYRPQYDTVIPVINSASNNTSQISYHVVITTTGQITSAYSGSAPFDDILHFYVRIKLD